MNLQFKLAQNLAALPKKYKINIYRWKEREKQTHVKNYYVVEKLTTGLTFKTAIIYAYKLFA